VSVHNLVPPKVSVRLPSSTRHQYLSVKNGCRVATFLPVGAKVVADATSLRVGSAVLAACPHFCRPCSFLDNSVIKVANTAPRPTRLSMTIVSSREQMSLQIGPRPSIVGTPSAPQKLASDPPATLVSSKQ